MRRQEEDHGAGDDHAACSARCIKGGSPAVFVADGKVYKISTRTVTAHAGHKVTLSGTMDGDTIKVDSVKM